MFDSVGPVPPEDRMIKAILQMLGSAKSEGVILWPLLFAVFPVVLCYFTLFSAVTRTICSRMIYQPYSLFCEFGIRAVDFHDYFSEFIWSATS